MPPGDRGMAAETRLGHLEGSRCLAALWVLCAHYLPKASHPSFNGAVFRVNVAICFFVVASGFMTHWAYAGCDFASCRGLLLFYVRRLGRVVFTFWVAMALACCVMRLLGTAHLDFGYLMRCFLFVEQWFQWCPNGPSWFVFALLPSWLLYPCMRRVVLQVEAKRGEVGLLVVFVVLWTLSFAPAVVLFILQGGNVTMQQHHDMSFWPPSQMADFALGVCTAAMAQRRVCVPKAAGPGLGCSCEGTGGGSGAVGSALPLGWLADASLALVALAVFVLPRPPRTRQMHLNGWEPLLDHGLAPLFAGFLYSSSSGSSGGLLVRLLGHKALVALGRYSFEVYIFQRPVHDLFRFLVDADSASVEAFVAYVLSLWLLAGLYAERVQAPLDRRLRAALAAWAARAPATGGPGEEYSPLQRAEACPRTSLAEASRSEAGAVVLRPL